MKKSVICLFCLLFVCFKISAESPKFLLHFDLENNFADVNLGSNDKLSFCQYYAVPYATVAWQLPADSSTRLYFGVRISPLLAVNHIEAYVRAGYAFEKSKSWENYHLEISGDLAAGAQIGFITSFSALPITDIGGQIFLMPEDRGFFLGMGPNCKMLYDVLSPDLNIFTSLSIKVSIGWKF